MVELGRYVWVDDIRSPPTSNWIVAKTIDEVKSLFKNGPILFMSLDHDLGGAYLCFDCRIDRATNETICGEQTCGCSCHEVARKAPTGYDIVKYCCENNLWPSKVLRIHSANPIGFDNMTALIDRYSPLIRVSRAEWRSDDKDVQEVQQQ